MAGANRYGNSTRGVGDGLGGRANETWANSGLGENANGAPGGGGMSGGTMAALGGTAMLGGALLDYYGQRQGAKAAEQEALRQAAEQEGMLQARHAAYMQALGRADPAQGGGVAGQQANLRMRAAAPAMAAGGKVLGLSGGQVASVGRALLPSQITGGQQAARGVMQQRRGENATQLSNEQGDLDAAMQGAAALYPMRNEIAKMKGAEYRTGGQMLGAAGMPLLVAGMSQPSGDAMWGDPNAPIDGGGFTQVPGAPTQRSQQSPWAMAPTASPLTRPYLPSGSLYPVQRR